MPRVYEIAVQEVKKELENFGNDMANVDKVVTKLISQIPKFYYECAFSERKDFLFEYYDCLVGLTKYFTHFKERKL